MKCSTGKKGHYTEEAAEEVLIQARIQFESNTAIAVYQCDVCQDWHLTSRGDMSTRLKKAIDDGSLQKEIDRYQWSQSKRY